MFDAMKSASSHLPAVLQSKWSGNCKFSLRIALAVVMLCNVVRSQTLLNELTTNGIEFRNGVKVVLPSPTLSGELNDEQFEQAKSKLAGNDGWEKFSRDSIVAPVTMKLEYVTDKDGTRVGHHVHSAFVVHAKLASLADQDLMQQIFGKPESSDGSGMKLVELTDADLKAAGVEVPPKEKQADKSINYSRVEFTLLEKIRLSGVMRIERTGSPNSATICWMLDPRFATNEKLRGTWMRIGSASNPSTISSGSYSGWGGYLNVVRVSQTPEVLVIESRMLLHELPEWFSASNFVRSKLPLAIQEGARNFRRKLK